GVGRRAREARVAVALRVAGQGRDDDEVHAVEAPLHRVAPLARVRVKPAEIDRAARGGGGREPGGRNQRGARGSARGVVSRIRWGLAHREATLTTVPEYLAAAPRAAVAGRNTGCDLVAALDAALAAEGGGVRCRN